jgi:hypothetical protein
MISLNEYKEVGNFSGLISKLFEARDFAHRVHLIAKSKSYAEHKALGSFYEGIVELADNLYETHAGQYGPAKFDFNKVPDEEPVEYFSNLAKICSSAHSSIDKKDTHLHNILDEITALVYHTIYKLKNLK